MRSFVALPLYAALLSTSVTASIAFADVTYGELPAGAESVSEQTGVHAEICRDHLLDPALAKMRLPDGYRFATATEIAAKDEALAKLLARSPRYGSHAVGSLCFMLADAFVVDDVRAHDAGPTAMAFSWARVTPSSDAAADPRMKGRISWVQLGSWYSDRGTDRARIRHTDPMAQFVALRVDEVAPDRWRLRMTLPDGVVRADVRVSGPRIRRNAPQPGFMTVLFSGDSADAFAVFTYFGHHHREAAGRWTASGRNAFAAAFRIDGEADAFGTVFQDGWQARAGLYRRR